MIDKNKFILWAKSRLGEFIESGPEIRFNSYWCEDKNHHLYCNPNGGKKKLQYGVYRCWKSEKKGTLVKLVMDVDNCSFPDALNKLGLSSTGRPIETFESEDFEPVKELQENLFISLELPADVISYSSCNEFWKRLTKQYVMPRCFDPEFFFVGVNGRYKGRIIIPYYDDKKNIIYYNGRTMINSKLRYLGPPKECGVGKSDVVFMQDWPKQNEKIYLCEGEFDSMSLNKSGLKGCAVGGKFVSLKQASILANKKICLAFDNDDAGQSACDSSKNILEKFGCTVTKVCPPTNIKDWNEFLVKYGPLVVKAYILRSEGESHD
jgi:hypothetical protein